MTTITVENKRIIDASRAFCNWCEGEEADSTNEAKNCLILLSDLYSSSMRLMICDIPDADSIEVDNWQINPDDWRAAYDRFDALPIGEFTEAQFPLEPNDSTVRSDLREELADIYEDVLEGLNILDQGHEQAALWHWKLTFEFHWGRRVLAAMNVLHAYFEEDSDWQVFSEEVDSEEE